MPLSALEKTPTGWGHGVKGVKFLICNTKKDAFRIVCRAIGDDFNEEPETFEGAEIVVESAEKVKISPTTYSILFKNAGMVWIDSGIIYCKEEG